MVPNKHCDFIFPPKDKYIILMVKIAIGSYLKRRPWVNVLSRPSSLHLEVAKVGTTLQISDCKLILDKITLNGTC